MGNVKVALNGILATFVAACIWGFSLHVAADSQLKEATVVTSSVSTSESGRHIVEFNRDRDYACTQCHKDEKDKLQGVHADALHAKTNRPITCIDCHGNVGPSHREGSPMVTKFAPAQRVAGSIKAASDPAWILKQNETCVQCHTADDLRQANWTHDVHARDLSCASCHNIHPTADPMQGISTKSRIKLCTDCHSDMTKAKQEVKP